MMMIAPRSSKMATLRRKALSAGGTRGPRRERIPRAKAMSVAAGMAQPFMAIGSPELRPA